MFETVVAKILSDADFRKSLIAAPEATLRAEGVEPTAELLDALNGATEESLQVLAQNFAEDAKAAG